MNQDNKSFEVETEEQQSHQDDLNEQYKELKETEEEETSRRNYFTLLICCIVILLAVLFSALSYYRVYKNKKAPNAIDFTIDESNTEINTIDSYTVSYDSKGSNYRIDGVTPGWESGEVQTFSIENNGSYTIAYDVLWTDVENTFEVPENVLYTITRNGTVVKSNTMLPTKEEYMLKNETVGANEKNTYVLSYQFVENGENQNYDQGKTFNANFKIVNAVFK